MQLKIVVFPTLVIPIIPHCKPIAFVVYLDYKVRRIF